jgi:8-oxo-dGTP pyrophosphatase MutT (NUDIX family)
VELLDADDPRLARSTDPQRSRLRLVEARLADADRDAERQRVLALLDEHGAALADRTTTPGHLTGSALVVSADGERILVLLHTKLRRWLQPGGHADGDHELARVALREATEETGIAGLRVLLPAVDLDVHAVDHGDVLGEHLHLDLRFVVVAPPGAVAVGNHESQALRWVTRDELGALADEPGLVRLADAGLAALAVD